MCHTRREFHNTYRTSRNIWFACSFLPFSDGRGRRFVTIKKCQKNLACRRQVFLLVQNKTRRTDLWWWNGDCHSIMCIPIYTLISCTDILCTLLMSARYVNVLSIELVPLWFVGTYLAWAFVIFLFELLKY